MSSSNIVILKTPIPINQCQFLATDKIVPDQTTGKFSGVAYAGGVINNGFFQFGVVFDLESTRFNRDGRLGILDSHEITKRIGSGQAQIQNNTVTVNGELFDFGDGEQVLAEAKAGFPFELSMHVAPGRIEEVTGTAVFVNGQEIPVGVLIWRDNLVREISFCAVAADCDTTASVFKSLTTQGLSMPKETTATQSLAEVQAQFNQANEQVASLTENLAVMTGERDSFKTKYETFIAEQKLSEIIAIKQIKGDKFSSDDEALLNGFSLDQLRLFRKNLAPISQAGSHLFTEQATSGQDVSDGVDSIVKQAQDLIFKAKVQGRDLSPADAVSQITAGGAAQ